MKKRWWERPETPEMKEFYLTYQTQLRAGVLESIDEVMIELRKHPNGSAKLGEKSYNLACYFRLLDERLQQGNPLPEAWDHTS